MYRYVRVHESFAPTGVELLEVAEPGAARGAASSLHLQRRQLAEDRPYVSPSKGPETTSRIPYYHLIKHLYQAPSRGVLRPTSLPTTTSKTLPHTSQSTTRDNGSRSPCIAAESMPALERTDGGVVMLTCSAKADKMLQSASGGFKLFGGREDKYMEAADLYKSAANAFKMQKQC